MVCYHIMTLFEKEMGIAGITDYGHLLSVVENSENMTKLPSCNHGLVPNITSLINLTNLRAALLYRWKNKVTMCCLTLLMNYLN